MRRRVYAVGSRTVCSQGEDAMYVCERGRFGWMFRVLVVK